MSLVYPKEEDIEYSVEVDNNQRKGGKIRFTFYADCGKFGAEECLDSIKITVKDLLTILQKYEEEKL